jgi:ABC-type Zn uptake system ZnuABC Zn-binding protein ZnuA
MARKIVMFALMVLSLGIAILPPTRSVQAQEAGKPLQVCVTVPELGSLVKEIGGNQVVVTVFAKGTENPHFVEAKPSLIKDLSQADLFVQMGLELEAGWVPVLLQNASNGKVLQGAKGYLDASKVISPTDIPSGTIDRSMGDVHPYGNPHYLTDPLNGLKVAALIRDKLSELRPGEQKYFQERYQAFRQKLGVAMVGDRLVRKYDFEKLATLYEHGKLLGFLKQQHDEALLGGWLGQMQSYFGIKAVADHNLWPYFGRRFGIEVIGFMEPIPGVPPTTKHLTGLIKDMQNQKVKLILASPFFDRRHIQFVASQTGARVAELAHQVGARPGTGDYLGMTDYNVRQLVSALK